MYVIAYLVVGLLRLKISLSIRNRTESILKSMESLLIFYPILSLSLDILTRLRRSEDVIGMYSVWLMAVLINIIQNEAIHELRRTGLFLFIISVD